MNEIWMNSLISKCNLKPKVMLWLVIHWLFLDPLYNWRRIISS
jgi:hypothetical protein